MASDKEKKTVALESKENEPMVSNEELIEEVDSGEEHFDPEHLHKLSIDDLKEVLNYLNIDDEKYKLVMQELESRPVPRIENAGMGHRVWSHYYDRFLLRVTWVLWFIFFNILKNVSPDLLSSTGLKAWDHKIYMGPGSAIQAQYIVLLLGFLGTGLIWRIIISYLESKRAHSKPGSSPARRRMGITIFSENGEPAGFWRIFLRSYFRVFPLSLLTLATMEISKNTRGIHDKIFKTRVLRVNADDVSAEEIIEHIKKH